MSTNRKSKSIRREEILCSARNIIALKGFEHLTVRQIAKDVRMTEGALYRHFKSKREIINLLIDDIDVTLMQTIEPIVKKEIDPLIKLEHILTSHIAYVEKRKATSFMLINETLNLKDKVFQRKMLQIMHSYLKIINNILLEGIRSGRFRMDINVMSASILFFGMVQSLSTFWAMSGFKYTASLKSRIKDSFIVYKNGILK
ncbi:MAG: TetR/AcrR family transcriptional regulator [Candidatus Omnitrophota bacterium]